MKELGGACENCLFGEITFRLGDAEFGTFIGWIRSNWLFCSTIDLPEDLMTGLWTCKAVGFTTARSGITSSSPDLPTVELLALNRS
jgi:hypothetical protein